jgi:nicotinate-nucleotide adenylyltransferase
MEVGLFFGSFNPVHVGHMILANHIVEHTSLKEVWMVLSPHNPLKPKTSLAKDHDRLHLLRLAIGENNRLRASDVEFSLPKPSYTIDTLVYLQEKYPQKIFSLIMGADNLSTLDKWKNYEILLERFKIYVYKRPGYDLGPYADRPTVNLIEAPLLDISATFIRECIKNGKSIQYLVPDKVFEYLASSKMYR